MKRSSSLPDSSSLQASVSTSHESSSAIDFESRRQRPRSSSHSSTNSSQINRVNMFNRNSTSHPAPNALVDASSFDYFLSDPSHSESEHDDSQMDRHRKFIYQQRRYNNSNIPTAVNNNTSNVRTDAKSDWDTSSFGNTSLSSSNVSPMFKPRIFQFDTSCTSFDTSSLGHIKEIEDANNVHDQQRSKLDVGHSNAQEAAAPVGRPKALCFENVTKKTKARRSFVRMTSETSESISSVDFDYRKSIVVVKNNINNTYKRENENRRCNPLVGDVDTLETALLPPSCADQVDVKNDQDLDNLHSYHNNNSGKYISTNQHEQISQTSKAPSLSPIQSELRETDIDIVTEQINGKTSSFRTMSLDSSITSTNKTSSEFVVDKMITGKLNQVSIGSVNLQTKQVDVDATGNEKKVSSSNRNSIPNNQTPKPKNKPTKKRQQSSNIKTNAQSSPTLTHCRQRSGDAMAANIVLKNTQQEVDWIGMRINGFPTPVINNTSSNVSNNNDSDAINDVDTLRYGILEPFTLGMSMEGESMSSSPSYNQLREKTGILPRKSSHLSFSDSSVPNSPPEKLVSSLQQRSCGKQQQFLHWQRGRQQQVSPRSDSPPYHQQQQKFPSMTIFDNRQKEQQQFGNEQRLQNIRPVCTYEYDERASAFDQNQQFKVNARQQMPHSRSLTSYHQQQQQQQQHTQHSRSHSNSFSSHKSVRDGDEPRFAHPNKVDNYNIYGSNQQASWNPSSQYTCHSSTGSLDDNTYEGTHVTPRERSVKSDSSDSSDSISSSSYDDDNYSSSTRAHASEFQRLNTDNRTARQAQNSARFDKVMKRVTTLLDAPVFRERQKKQDNADETRAPPTFFCPNCKTRQRAFIDITTAASQFESPLGYLALYFALYLVSVLFVFGLEEGWTPLECVYFAVITLTTAGLGDFVPSSNTAKLICACFIYFGVATIGLLLGSILAGSLDDASKKDHHQSLVRDCPNCLRLEKQKSRLAINRNINFCDANINGEAHESFYEPVRNLNDDVETQSVGLDLNEKTIAPSARPVTPLKRQHTKHMSLALDSTQHSDFLNSIQHKRRMSADFETINENSPFFDKSSSSYMGEPTQHTMDTKPISNDDTSTTTASSESSSDLTKPMSRLKAVKYIVLTLNRALLNSLLIIFVGSTGFYFIEGMTLVDSFYFTTVLLTTVGYGDIVPVSDSGKVFTTVYVIVAGTILLHNMSLISMIPLELRKHRIEQAVLGQFGNQLTDDELQELSTGRLIQRLKLATNRPDGLNECTREMFALAMLVRLGRITEDDVKATFTAFRRLDVGNYGTLNSRSIIEGEIWRIRSCKNLASMAASQSMISPRRLERSWSADDSLELSQASVHYNPYSYVMESQNLFMNPASNADSQESLQRIHSSESVPNTPYSDSISSSFDFDAYERWSRGWYHR